MFTEQLTQALAVMAQLPSSNLGTGTTNIGVSTSGAPNTGTGVDMSVFRRLIVYYDVGIIGASANIQAYFQASATANMASPTNVAGSIPLTFNTSSRVESLEVRADQLPAGTRYVRPVIVVNTAACNVGVIALAGESSYKPASSLNTANVLDQGVVT